MLPYWTFPVLLKMRQPCRRFNHHGRAGAPTRVRKSHTILAGGKTDLLAWGDQSLLWDGVWFAIFAQMPDFGPVSRERGVEVPGRVSRSPHRSGYVRQGSGTAVPRLRVAGLKQYAPSQRSRPNHLQTLSRTT